MRRSLDRGSRIGSDRLSERSPLVGSRRYRNAILAAVVIVAAAVIVVIVVVGVTLKICGSEKRTAEHRPWQSEAAGSRLRVLGPEVPDEAGGGGREEEEEEEAGRTPLEEKGGDHRVRATTRTDRRKDHRGKWRTSRRCWPMSAT